MNASDVLSALWQVALYNAPNVTAAGLGAIVCIMLGCRVAKMVRGVTSLVVFMQHAGLAVGIFGAVLLSFANHSEWSAASAIAGVLIFLLLSVRRWRHAPPAGTARPAALEVHQLRHVHGGKRSDA